MDDETKWDDDLPDDWDDVECDPPQVDGERVHFSNIAGEWVLSPTQTVDGMAPSRRTLRSTVAETLVDREEEPVERAPHSAR